MCSEIDPKSIVQDELERKNLFIFEKGLSFKLLASFMKGTAHLMRMNVFHKSTRIDPKHVEAHPVFRNKPGQ